MPNESLYWLKFQEARSKYSSALTQIRNKQMQWKCDKVSIQNCHKFMTGATSNITPPKIINNVAGHQEQLEMWTAHYRKTLNCYSDSYNPETKQLKSTNIAPKEFDLHSVLQITLKLDPKKAYKRHLLWKYPPTIPY